MSAQQQGQPVPRQQLLSWYSSLNKQMGTVSKKRDPGLLMPQGKRVDARNVVALSARLQPCQLAALEQLPQPLAALSAQAAMVVHDAALLCSMLGHLPPVRQRTSAHPDYSGRRRDEACLSPGTCPGNRFTWVDTVERSKLRVHGSTTRMVGGECCFLPPRRPRRMPSPFKAVSGLQLVPMHTCQVA